MPKRTRSAGWTRKGKGPWKRAPLAMTPVDRSQNKVIKSLGRRLKALAPEIKYYDLSGSGVAFDFTMGTGSFHATALITQGITDFGTRIGDQVKLVRLVNRMTFAFPTAITATKYRVIYFQYKNNPDAVTPSPATICNFYMDSAYDGSANIVNAPRDHDNRHAFRTLYDRTFAISQQSSASQIVKYLTINLNLHNTKLSWTAATANVVQNAIYCIVVSDTATDANLSYVQRLYYTDA